MPSLFCPLVSQNHSETSGLPVERLDGEQMGEGKGEKKFGRVCNLHFTVDLNEDASKLNAPNFNSCTRIVQLLKETSTVQRILK